MRRVPEVLDCWFESGSMPFAQVHYPFENKEWFDTHAPADFIVEYIAQTRGWFYTMHVLSVALFDRPAFRNVHLPRRRARRRRPQALARSCATTPTPKRSSRRSAPTPLRWYLMASPILRGGDLQDRQGRLGHRRRGAPGRSTRSGTPSTSSRCTPTSTATRRQFRTDATGDARPLPAGQDAARSSRPSPTRMDAYDLAGACNRDHRLPRRAQQLVHPPSRERFWAPGAVDADRRSSGRQGRRLRHALHRARHGLEGGRAAAADADRGDPHGPHRRALASTWPTGPTRRSLPADPDLVAGHGRSAGRLLHGARPPRGAQAPQPAPPPVAGGRRRATPPRSSRSPT